MGWLVDCWVFCCFGGSVDFSQHFDEMISVGRFVDFVESKMSFLVE